MEERSKGWVKPVKVALCPDCRVQVGQEYVSGSDIERCSECLQQWIGCGCAEHDSEQAVWTGELPGIAEAVFLGLWCCWVEGKGWVPCTQGSPGADIPVHQITGAE